MGCTREEALKKKRDYYRKNRDAIIKYQYAYKKTKRGREVNYLSHIKSMYKLTSIDYNSLLNKQAGLCAICRGLGPLKVDHCHSTGRVRGLLCHSCNVALGSFKDNIVNLSRAIGYVTRGFYSAL